MCAQDIREQNCKKKEVEDHYAASDVGAVNLKTQKGNKNCKINRA